MWSAIKRLLYSKEEPPVYDLALCCIAKDENEYLEEWMKYHLKVGVQHFFIYDNESRTPISETLAVRGLAQYATVKRIRGKAKHIKAYQDCLNRYGGTSRWIGFIDVDEFIVPKSTNGNLVLFLKEYEPYGGLGISWLIFGSGGHTQRTHRPQLESFIWRSEKDFAPNRHIKSIVQPKFVKSAFKSHCFRYVAGKYCVNEHFVKIEESVSEVSVDKIQLNHYYCRSLEEYQDKVKRGISDTRKERKLDSFYAHDLEANKVKDTTILELMRALESALKP